MGNFLSISIKCSHFISQHHCKMVVCSFLTPQDGNGYIDENELDALLKDLCEKNKQVMYLTCYLLVKQILESNLEQSHIFWKST